MIINDVYKVKVETNSFGNDSWSMMWITVKVEKLIVLVMIVNQWCE